jgi:hypothetical protein
VRYDPMNAMLLNDFVKEHRDIADLKCVGICFRLLIAR